MLGRNYNDNDHEIQTFRQQLQLKKQEIAQLSSTVRDLRANIKEVEGDGDRKRRDLVERCNFLEGEARKYK